jgi:uncharacterized membrane protein
MAERGRGDQASVGDHSAAGQFTESLGFQAELVAWQGPLPPPQVLAEYDRVVPGSAQRIMAMAETVISGPIQNAAKLTDAEIEATKWGLSFAMALTSVTTLASALFFALAIAGVGSTAACITEPISSCL